MVGGSKRTLRQSRVTLTATFSLKGEGEQESLRVFCEKIAKLRGPEFGYGIRKSSDWSRFHKLGRFARN